MAVRYQAVQVAAMSRAWRGLSSTTVMGPVAIVIGGPAGSRGPSGPISADPAVSYPGWRLIPQPKQVG